MKSLVSSMVVRSSLWYRIECWLTASQELVYSEDAYCKNEDVKMDNMNVLSHKIRNGVMRATTRVTFIIDKMKK